MLKENPMADLYKITQTNSNPDKNKQIKKFEIISEYKNYTLDTKFNKNITCFCGSCTLVLNNGAKSETVIMNNADLTVEVKRNIEVSIENLTKDAKVSVEYYDTKNPIIVGNND